MIEGRIYNFSAGPSILPEEVLLKAQAELLNCEGSGMSVLEMSHRSKVFDDIIKAAEANMRKIMNIPDNYKVLFLQGGASGVFASLPMNLGNKNKVADYIVSGNFSGGALKEAKKYLDAREIATTKDVNFTRIPRQDELKLSPDADYVHVCWNNTIFGTKYQYIPDTGDVPLVADMSSSILSEPVDVSKFGMIYAGVQKNLAPAGMAIVIVREDLIGNAMPITPKIWDYKIMADKESMLNTPPCFPIYFVKLVTDYLMEQGGLEEMQRRNEEKAKILYDYLDSQDFFKAAACKEDRSLMNVTFRTGDDALDAEFVKGQAAHGFSNLKGHRLVGGMRASIYNAMPKEGVAALVEYMKEFAAAHQ
ncbi:MAG: 3-phosphoserine/phosphohydroxythreonine transaminase [Lachnospiraceae bacterium]|jgi:phosphoserine aminotransferase|nr:3-phosphoserine/phosphohydroxythreonine transaminase [Lachnospiraceae bacterium]